MQKPKFSKPETAVPSASATCGTPGSRQSGKPGFNDAESPLSWLRSRRGRDGLSLISDEQFLAGEKLRADFERALLARRTTTNWDTAGSGSRSGNSAAEISDGAMAARQRYQQALVAVGPELASMLRQVCCLESGIEAAERALNLPQRSGRAVLAIALTGLARHYGLLGRRDTRGRIDGWGAAGYRPGIAELEEA